MRWLLVLVAWMLLTVPALAQDRVIRIWGTPAMLETAERWAKAFEESHPDVRFEFAMKGSDSAIHGLVGGVADLALMGRENDIVDDNGFFRPRQYPVTRIEIATGSVATPGKSDAVAVLVHPENPLTAITLEQLGQILDCGDQPRPISVWRDLGLGGPWAQSPIRVHSYDFATRTGVWIQDRVTGRDRRMCWDRITEYADQRRLDGTVEKAADRAGSGARDDRHALLIANPAQARNGMKLLAVSDGGAPVLPSAASVQARSYPLHRRAYAFYDRAPGKQMAPHLRAFLRFVLSDEGQGLLGPDTGYLPLERAVAETQLSALEPAP